MSDNAALIIFENDRVSTYSLCGRKQWTIGRGSDNVSVDISILSPIVGKLHGQFIQFGSEWFYTDNGSINGTYYNGRRIKNGINGSITPIILSEGDVLRIDSGNFENPDPRGVLMVFTMNGRKSHWNKYIIGNKRKIVVGSDSGKCNIIAESEKVVSKYFTIKSVKRYLQIFTCDGSKEIFINNRPVQSKMELKEKDVIRIDNKYWIYSNNNILYNT